MIWRIDQVTVHDAGLALAIVAVLLFAAALLSACLDLRAVDREARETWERFESEE